MKIEVIKELMKKGDLLKILEGIDSDDYDYNYGYDLLNSDDAETIDIPDEDPDYDNWEDDSDSSFEYEDDENVEYDDSGEKIYVDDNHGDLWDLAAASADEDFADEDPSKWKFILDDNFTTKDASDKILKELIDSSDKFKKVFTESKIQQYFDLPLTPFEKRNFQKYMNSLEGDDNRLHLSKESQYKVFLDAQEGNFYARTYLYTRYLRITAKAYWVYYVEFLRKGNPNRSAEYFIDGASASMVSTLGWQMLSNDNHLDGKEYASPYTIFNSSKYSEDTDLLQVFSWWYFRYLQDRVIIMIRKLSRGGITGRLKKEEYRNAIVASLQELKDENSHLEPAVDSFENKLLDDIYLEQTIIPLFNNIQKWADGISMGNTKKYYSNLCKWRLFDQLSFTEIGNKLIFPDEKEKNYSQKERKNKAARYWKNFLGKMKKDRPDLYQGLLDMRDDLSAQSTQVKF